MTKKVEKRLNRALRAEEHCCKVNKEMLIGLLR